MVRIVNHHPRGGSNNNNTKLNRRYYRLVVLIIIIVIGIILITAFILLRLSLPLLESQTTTTTTTTGATTTTTATTTKEEGLLLRGGVVPSNQIKNHHDVLQPPPSNMAAVVVTDLTRNGGSTVHTDIDNSVVSTTRDSTLLYPSCPYRKLTDLSPEERFPYLAKGRRHIVTPPKDGNITLVCCHTTVGTFNILVHINWAPYGAQRFLNMISTQYFDTSVPFMRCIYNFICQFGLNGNPISMKSYIGSKNTLPDDPNWLPEGPKYRIDPITKIKRFQQGYLAYAGAGKHSRDVQFIIALQDNGPLGGGSPWEVPFGELVGNHSYTTLAKIYTGYGENGPSQGLLYKADALKIVKEKYPLLDYIQSCYITDSAVSTE